MTMSTASVEDFAPAPWLVGQTARARQTVRFVLGRTAEAPFFRLDGFDLAAAGFAVCAPFLAMRAVDAALAKDLAGALAAALGMAGAVGLEAISRHCRSWRDEAAAYCDARPRPRFEVAVAVGCAGAAAILNPLGALAAVAVILVALSVVAVLQDAATAADADAGRARTQANDELNAPTGAAAAVKAAGLEMAFARRFEHSDDAGLGARLDAAGAAATAASIASHARIAAVAAVVLLSLVQAGGDATGVVVALALLAARMADPLSACVRRPTAIAP